MPEKDPNLEGTIESIDLSNIDLTSIGGGESTVGVPNKQDKSGVGEINPDKLDKAQTTVDGEISSMIDENLFLDSGEPARIKVRPDDIEKFGTYLRWFFLSSFITLISIVAIALLFSFNTYITRASKTPIDATYQSYVDNYKDKLEKVKDFVGLNNKGEYQTPSVKSDQAQSEVNKIISSDEIDYIDKRDLLAPYVSDLSRNAKDYALEIDRINKDVARQGFLPEELEKILSEEQAIDTIQRSLNALEVIKFSTAMKVFSYMDTAIQTISEMVRVNGASSESIGKLLKQVTSRGEKDISSYVYMCYLNPFETNANCDTIGDLDLYYNSIIKDDTINLKLFKNVMNVINQLLEKEDTSLFSITFNGFNAKDKNITFNIEVYTNQNDEKSLMSQGKKNPNIFILTNIVNLLKQSSFIIGSEINTKEVNVEQRELNLGGFTTTVNYSSKDFTVPIQKDMEREIFDYIDLDAIIKMLKKDKDGSVDNSDYDEELLSDFREYSDNEDSYESEQEDETLQDELEDELVQGEDQGGNEKNS